MQGIFRPLLDHAQKSKRKTLDDFLKSSVFKAFSQSMRQDSNLRPLRPERSALPS